MRRARLKSEPGFDHTKTKAPDAGARLTLELKDLNSRSFSARRKGPTLWQRRLKVPSGEDPAELRRLHGRVSASHRHQAGPCRHDGANHRLSLRANRPQGEALLPETPLRRIMQTSSSRAFSVRIQIYGQTRFYIDPATVRESLWARLPPVAICGLFMFLIRSQTASS